MKILFFDEQDAATNFLENNGHQKAIAVPDWMRLDRVVVADTLKTAIRQLKQHQDIELILTSAKTNLQLLSQTLKVESISCPIFPLKPYYDAFVEDGMIGKPAVSDAWLGLENTIGTRGTSHHNQTRRRSTSLNLGRSLAEVERELILETLVSCGGNRTYASDILGISVRTLRNKLVQYGEQGKTIPSHEKRKAPSLMAAKSNLAFS